VGKLAAVASTGVEALLLHPLRSATSLACLVAVVLPFVAGAGVARGLLDQVEESIDFGADLHVTASRFGRPAPVPLELVGTIRAVPGVRDAFPRIVGEVVLGVDRLPCVVVGLPAERLASAGELVEGRPWLPGASDELVVGAELASRLELQVGARLPPFYRNESGERVSTVVGILRADLPIWAGNVMFCSFETAGRIFDQAGLATSLLVTCEPGNREAVRRRLRSIDELAPRDDHGPLAVILRSKDDLAALLPSSLRHLEGIFTLHFVLAFAVGIPLLMVTSGIGLAERRREAALLKALGWMTDEVLLRGMVESALIALLGASLATVLAGAWLGLLNGAGIVGVFLPGAPPAVAFELPFRLLPVPALLAFVISFAVVATGTLHALWRAATAPPALALR